MSIKVDLPAEIEQRFPAQARERGVSVVALVRQHIIDTAPPTPPAPEAHLSPAEWERALDEWLESLPVGEAPLPDHAYSRESIDTSDAAAVLKFRRRS